ncbi:MAG: nitroreductase family protein [Desulfobacterales bacterium]|jgi:nitroreductase
MNFMSLIAKRRSIRRFKNKKIESHKIDTLIEAALRAPSSRGVNPWEFIVVNDTSVLEKLSKAKPHGAAFLANAALGIVVCANADQSDVWVEDAAIASIYIHLAATSLGLGSCWIQIRKRMHDENKTAQAYVAEVLVIPQNLRVESIVAIGHPDEEKSAHPNGQLSYQKAHMNRYGTRYDMT